MSRRYPRRIDIPLLLCLSGLLLGYGLTLPALETRTLLFWRDEYSILTNILELGRTDRQFAAAILAGCSIVYPASKLLVLIYFWLMPFPFRWRSRLIRFLHLLGRWSMVDVFTISAIVLASATIGPLEATPQIGLFCFAGGMIALMLVSLLMDRLARKGIGR